MSVSVQRIIEILLEAGLHPPRSDVHFIIRLFNSVTSKLYNVSWFITSLKVLQPVLENFNLY